MPRIIQKGDVTKPIASDFYFAIDSNTFGVKRLLVSDVCLKENNGVGDVGGYFFDGEDDYVSQTTINNRSIMLLIYPTANNRAILNFGTNLNISINTSNQVTLGSGFSGVTTYVNGVQTNQLTLNSWNFIVCNYNEITTTTLEIGRSGSSYFAGRIALVRVYNSQLTQSEIAQHYNNGRPDLYTLPFADRQASQTNLITSLNFNDWTIVNNAIINNDNTFSVATNPSIPAVIKKHYFYPTNHWRRNLRISISGTMTGNLLRMTNAGNGAIYKTITTSSFNEDFIIPPFTMNGYIELNLIGPVNSQATITKLEVYPVGCVAEYRPEFAGRIGWLEIQNRLHGQTFGSPISLAVNNNELIYRDIKNSITGNTALTNIIPAQYRIKGILVNNTTSNSVTINIGTTSNGNDVVNGLVCPAGLTFVNDAQILKKIFSLTSDQTLFVSSSNWNSASLNIEFGMTRY